MGNVFTETANGKINKTLVFIFLVINGIVFYNAIFHLPWIGYDAIAHAKNIVVLSRFRLPTAHETYMFYMPPLSYSLPALIQSLTSMSFFLLLKIAQLLNFVYSLGLTLYLLKICNLIRPGKTFFKIISLSFLGMMPVYYKTFAFIRGEPLVAFLTVFALYKTIVILIKNEYSARNILTLGIALGLMVLSRQTGLFVYPAIVIFITILAIRQKEKFSLLFRTTIIIFLIAFTVGGWFYIHLYKNYGTIASYNVKPKEKFSLSNQSSKFYFDPVALQKLFKNPIRPIFLNSFFPTFYSEFWGDYLCYFIVYGRNIKKGDFISGLTLAKVIATDDYQSWLKTNRKTVKKYLGRVNLISLFPSAIMLAGLILGMSYLIKSIISIHSYDETLMMFSLLVLVVGVSFAAFFYFLIMYPSPYKGDNIKATYMLHTFPLIAILAGEFVYKIKQKSAFWCTIILILLTLIVLHNSSAFFTRYVPWQ